MVFYSILYWFGFVLGYGATWLMLAVIYGVPVLIVYYIIRYFIKRGILT